jgi:two-component system phosphate regulon response regulator PhoB
MAREHILVVDDEENILELVKYNLTKEGYRTTCITTGEEALKQLKSGLPDLIVLDLMLPGVDGLEVCRQLKGDRETSQTPIVMLTAKSEEADIVAGLELGADDYVTKPFSPRVLLARIKAVLRRKAVTVDKEATSIKRGDLMIDSTRYEATVKGKVIELTSTEFKLLRFLAAKPGRVFTRHQIMDSVRGDDYVATDRSVDVQIAGLRRKLGPLSANIETVRGVGYRFKD